MIHIATLAVALAGGVVHGTVRADSTLEPIAHATVELPALGRRIAADERGYYVLADVPEGTWAIRVSALGYRPRELEVDIVDGRTLRLDVALVLSPLQLEGIEVTTERRGAAPVAAAGPPPVRVDGPSLSIVPGLAEADVFRALQTLPSIAAVSDFSSALYVRGGAPDQNLLLLDGAPLFNPFHLGGVFAAFDPSTIATVDVLPGAFPASAGDRLSSVIALNTRDGGRDRLRGSGAIGLISSRASIDGPLPGGRGSYLLSLRRTYVDLFTDLAYALDFVDFTLPYAFTDGHLKLTHDVGAAGSISASFYVDREGIHVPEEMAESDGTDAQLTWGSYAASVTYRRPIGGTLLAELRAAVSAFAGDFELWEREYVPSTPDPYGPVEPGELEKTTDAHTTVRDALVGADLTWYGRRHRVAVGVQADAYRFDHDIGPEGHAFEDIIPTFRRTDRPTTVAAYVEDQWSVTDAFQLRGGLRVLHAGARGTAWMPRFGARYALPSGLAFNLGAGRYTQVMHSLRDEESVYSGIMAYDVPGAVAPGAGLPATEDVVLGVEWRAPDTEIRVDGYLKRTTGLRLPPPPADPADAPIFVIHGRRPASSLARGVEITARHRRGAAEFSASYALAFAELDVGGERYPPRYDRRHTLDVSATLPLGARGTFSARLAAATGQPYTTAVARTTVFRYDPTTGKFYRFINGDFLLLGEHNGARLPGYLRLDVAARKAYDKPWFGGITVTPYVQVINVLNSRNVLFADPNQFYYGSGRPVAEYLPQLPFLPTFGVEWRF
ncbi:MAG TPA: TonB-dependent receptor [Longimicrobiales bacterium]